MANLIQLPKGQWVAPDRVSSVSVMDREFDTPCVVVNTKDNAKFVISVNDWVGGQSLRDDIAKQINDALGADKK